MSDLSKLFVSPVNATQSSLSIIGAFLPIDKCFISFCVLPSYHHMPQSTVLRFVQFHKDYKAFVSSSHLGVDPHCKYNYAVDILESTVTWHIIVRSHGCYQINFSNNRRGGEGPRAGSRLGLLACWGSYVDLIFSVPTINKELLYERRQTRGVEWQNLIKLTNLSVDDETKRALAVLIIHLGNTHTGIRFVLPILN